MFLIILSSVALGYILGKLSIQGQEMKKKQIRIVIAIVSLCIIGFFGFKALTKKAEAGQAGTLYTEQPKAQEPITMSAKSILGCIRWVKGDDNKNYCVIGG